MPKANFILLYVDSPTASGDFYRALLGREPVEASPTFVMFALAPEFMLGLWSRHTVQPPPATAGGGGELAFTLESPEAVDAACASWKALGLPIVQAPTAMDFGRTFVALDPDGHRLRVFSPAGD